MSEALERGDIFFFYRPRVGTEKVHGIQDVQRTFMVMKPDRKRRYRRLIVGRKRLPDPDTHEREWAFVVEVTETPRELRDDIEAMEYETRTRGRRFEPEARPAGEARYAIVDHDGHTHLAYALELPPEPGEVQRALCIQKEASYIVAVGNPEAPVRPGVGLRPNRRAEFPAELQQRFRGRRFIPLNPPDFLDYVGAEVVLIGAAKDARSELGIELDAGAEAVESADIFRKLRLRPGELPTEPLKSGKWR